MGHEVSVSDSDRKTAQFGIMIQLRSRVKPEVVKTFLENGGQEFIDNQIEVLAQERAMTRFYSNIVCSENLGS